MIVVTTQGKEQWNEIVKSFPQWDIYYLCEYAQSLQLHGDGEPLLLYWESGNERLCYVVMKNDIAEFAPFQSILKKGLYFDFTTPYGYGGPLTNDKLSKATLDVFFKELYSYCIDEHIVTQFIRFHPLYQNQEVFKGFSDIRSMKETIFIETSSSEIIMKNIDSKNRNMIRKAEKNHVEIQFDHGERIDDFIRIYESTMMRNSADDYYYFSREYFKFIAQEMKDQIIFFYSIFDNKVIGASIFFYNKQFMHYHLSGVLEEYKSLASSNLLIYKAALWGAEKGISKFHLGGGINADDSLFFFKKRFNNSGNLDFNIGRNIFMQDVYDQLIEMREKNDKHFDNTKPFMIKYRG